MFLGPDTWMIQPVTTNEEFEEDLAGLVFSTHLPCLANGEHTFQRANPQDPL